MLLVIRLLLFFRFCNHLSELVNRFDAVRESIQPEKHFDSGCGKLKHDVKCNVTQTEDFQIGSNVSDGAMYAGKK